MEKPDLERFPLITPAGWANYRRIREHPAAPRWNHYCGNRLTAAGLEAVRAFAAQVQAEPGWRIAQPPAWLAPFAAHCFEQVPIYRAWGRLPPRFEDIPTCSRADLARAAHAFVPDDQDIREMVAYATSGTTGHPIDVYWHPASSAMYVPLLQAALALHGAAFRPGPTETGCVLVCFQQSTYTLVSVAPYLDHAGFAKINLAPQGWKDPADRVRFLDDLAAQVYNGDPLSFAALAELPLRARPAALISTSMHLSEGLRRRLEERFACPVIDLYAMNEAGPIAARLPGEEGFALLQPRLYVEILDPHGQACPPGVRGEITLSGGFNPYIPLLRYRSGDYAALQCGPRGQPRLVNLEGRPPVAFHTADGHFVNNIDVTLALRPLALEQFQLHQFGDGRLRLNWRGSAQPEDLRAALTVLFGPATPLELVEGGPDVPAGGKIVQYTTEMAS